MDYLFSNERGQASVSSTTEENPVFVVAGDAWLALSGSVAAATSGLTSAATELNAVQDPPKSKTVDSRNVKEERLSKKSIQSKANISDGVLIYDEEAIVRRALEDSLVEQSILQANVDIELQAALELLAKRNKQVSPVGYGSKNYCADDGDASEEEMMRRAIAKSMSEANGKSKELELLRRRRTTYITRGKAALDAAVTEKDEKVRQTLQAELRKPAADAIKVEWSDGDEKAACSMGGKKRQNGFMGALGSSFGGGLRKKESSKSSTLASVGISPLKPSQEFISVIRSPDNLVSRNELFEGPLTVSVFVTDEDENEHGNPVNKTAYDVVQSASDASPASSLVAPVVEPKTVNSLRSATSPSRASSLLSLKEIVPSYEVVSIADDGNCVPRSVLVAISRLGIKIEIEEIARSVPYYSSAAKSNPSSPTGAAISGIPDDYSHNGLPQLLENILVAGSVKDCKVAQCEASMDLKETETKSVETTSPIDIVARNAEPYSAVGDTAENHADDAAVRWLRNMVVETLKSHPERYMQLVVQGVGNLYTRSDDDGVDSSSGGGGNGVPNSSNEEVQIEEGATKDAVGDDPGIPAVWNTTGESSECERGGSFNVPVEWSYKYGSVAPVAKGTTATAVPSGVTSSEVQAQMEAQTESGETGVNKEGNTEINEAAVFHRHCERMSGNGIFFEEPEFQVVADIFRVPVVVDAVIVKSGVLERRKFVPFESLSSTVAPGGDSGVQGVDGSSSSSSSPRLSAYSRRSSKVGGGEMKKSSLTGSSSSRARSPRPSPSSRAISSPTKTKDAPGARVGSRPGTSPRGLSGPGRRPSPRGGPRGGVGGSGAGSGGASSITSRGQATDAPSAATTAPSAATTEVNSAAGSKAAAVPVATPNQRAVHLLLMVCTLNASHCEPVLPRHRDPAITTAPSAIATTNQPNNECKETADLRLQGGQSSEKQLQPPALPPVPTSDSDGTGTIPKTDSAIQSPSPSYTSMQTPLGSAL